LAAARVNAARPLGDPGTDLDAALAAVSDWYTQRRMRPRLLVVTGSRLDRELERRGWRPRYDCLICVATVARLRHKLEGVHAEPAIAIERTASPQWWALFRGGNQPDAARPVVEGGPDVALATVIGPGDEAARAVGRACVDPPWIGLSSIAVAPEHRRRGYARSVIGALVEYGAQRGGVRVYLEVLADNTAALALYESLGFTRHHGYRYREWPDEPAQPSSER
jgi:GNAT superfamily N-acetyltransferase